ncbi:MAG: glycosyltransferase [Candidatus Rokubacteria bacterium]|nr:glycosyltransferase [Candidatus Rokubacteria bacterium]
MTPTSAAQPAVQVRPAELPAAAAVKLSILMAVKNEGATLPATLKILNALIEVPHEILIVYDDPDDTTVPVVRRFQERHPAVRLIHNTRGPGVVHALRAGIAEAAGEYVLIFAIDDTGPALALDQMLALMDRGCDLVSCTRYARGGRRLGGSLIGGLLSLVANRLFCTLSGTALTDSTTGIKMMRRDRLQRLTLEASAGWAVALELSIKAQLAGWRVGEVPIISIDRLFGGRSTFTLGAWLPEYFRWFVWGVAQCWRTGHRPQPVMTPLDLEDAASPAER